MRRRSDPLNTKLFPKNNSLLFLQNHVNKQNRNQIGVTLAYFFTETCVMVTVKHTVQPHLGGMCRC